MKKSFGKLLSGVLCAALLVSLAPAAFAADTGTTLTILGTSDLHGNVWGYSYESMTESTGDGMARISTYVSQVRAENPNTILVDAGDSIQGTIMTDDLYSDKAANHPVMAAMNYMKYDAWTLGNHEFNWGVDNLKTVMAQSNAPVLAANIKNADGSYFTGKGWTIVEKGGVSVAIIGVDTPNIPRWDGTKQGISDLKFEPLVDGVKQAVTEIGDKADIIMVTAHAGYDSEYTADDAASAILTACPEVDLLQCAHTHTTYINNDGAVPIGQTKNNAGEVVRYDVTLDAGKNITSAKVETVSMKDVAVDEGLRAVPAIKDAQDKTVSFIKDNVLGHAAADFQPADEIKGIPAGRMEDTAVIDLIGTVQLENSKADVTAVALFKDTSDLKKGDLNYGNVFDIYTFPNVLYTVKVTGKEMKAYMEWAAECWNQWVPGDVTLSFNQAKPSYLHDHFIGLNYEVNLSKPAGERIENVTFKGAPLTDDQTLTLCVNDYRFSGLKTAGIISGEKEWESSNSVRDMIVEYLAKHDPLEPVVDNNWTITGVDLQKDSAGRKAILDKINAGTLAAPYYKSVNLNEANNVIVNGLLHSANVLSLASSNATHLKDLAAAAAGENAHPSYYRLRDLATALKGTDGAFNVEWNNGVVVTAGGEYTADALPVERIPAAATQDLAAAPLTLTLDGAAATVTAVVYEGNYYITADGLASLLGVTATEADEVLTITAAAKGNTSTGG